LDKIHTQQLMELNLQMLKPMQLIKQVLVK